MGGGVVAGNFFTHTSYRVASSCDDKLPANSRKIDVAGNWLRFDQWREYKNNCTPPGFHDGTCVGNQ
jgi:hypothetical protein